MIKSLSLTNFKSISRLENFEIRPITILMGKNSSGKSSILQSLLLLKQSIQSEFKSHALALDGKYLQYTHLREISFGVPQEPTAMIGYSLVIDYGGTLARIDLEFRHKQNPKSGAKGPVLNKISITDEENSKKKFVARLIKGKYVFDKQPFWSQYPNRKSKDGTVEETEDISLDIDGFSVRGLRVHLVHTDSNGIQTRRTRFLPMFLQKFEPEYISYMLQRELQELKYLGPSRALPRRAYLYYSQDKYQLAEDGSNAASILWLRRDEQVNFGTEQMTLLKATLACLKIMGLKQEITPRRYSQMVYQLYLSLESHPQKKVTIADVGFGYSQVLPIIMLGLLSRGDSLILFEQPEIHLHPASCANLADLFIKFSESGCHMIIETHSTELVNRLRLRVLERPNLAEKSITYFIEPPKPEKLADGATVRMLNLNSDGMFNEWPEGFLDESQKNAREILNKRLETHAKK